MVLSLEICAEHRLTRRVLCPCHREISRPIRHACLGKMMHPHRKLGCHVLKTVPVKHDLKLPLRALIRYELASPSFESVI